MSTAKAYTKIIEKYKIHPTDTGSCEVQIAIFSNRILELTGHMRQHKHDNSARRGLINLVNSRRKLLKYLKRQNQDRYTSIINSLGLRGL